MKKTKPGNCQYIVTQDDGSVVTFYHSEIEYMTFPVSGHTQYELRDGRIFVGDLVTIEHDQTPVCPTCNQRVYNNE